MNAVSIVAITVITVLVVQMIARAMWEETFWYALHVQRLAMRTHVRTDPRCRIHRAPREGSLLDRASRGAVCGRCAHVRVWER